MKIAEALSLIRASRLKHYVYVLHRPDTGVPFYVGKGTGKRIARHAWNVKKYGSRTKHQSIILKYHRLGMEIEYSFDSFHMDHESAYKRENQLINDLGRSQIGTGPLANLNDGGVGNHGHVRSEEAKRHHSEMMKGRPKSEAHKKQIGDLRRGIPKSPEYRLKISAGVKKAHADGRLTSLCKDPRARALKAWETKRARYGTELPWSKTKGKT